MCANVYFGNKRVFVSDSDGIDYGTGIKQRIEGDTRFMENKVTLTLK